MGKLAYYVEIRDHHNHTAPVKAVIPTDEPYTFAEYIQDYLVQHDAVGSHASGKCAYIEVIEVL